MVTIPVAASSTMKEGAFVRVTSACPQDAVDHETPAASLIRSLETVKVTAPAPVLMAGVDVVGAVVMGSHV